MDRALCGDTTRSSDSCSGDQSVHVSPPGRVRGHRWDKIGGVDNRKVIRAQGTAVRPLFTRHLAATSGAAVLRWW